ncbi:MAG: SUF system Fe-S cluster assembly protein [Acetobacteraceae bacterium]|nr:SUF system Fe-S cluster assembly protein [Acetobacteraceae bacterium]
MPEPGEVRDARLAHAQRGAGRRRRSQHRRRRAVSEAPTHAAWTPEGEQLPRVSEDKVIDAIKTVFDPEIPVDIYELGLIYAIELADDGAVKVEMTLTTPSCPSAQELPSMVDEAVRGVPGVTSCNVEVVWDPPWDQSRMSEDARLALNMY